MHDSLHPLWQAFRRHLLRLWLSRGGGYYGLVAALTFCYLEVIGVAGDVKGATHLQMNLGWFISFFINNVVAAFLNGMAAALWPLKWIGMFGVGTKLLALLAGSYVVYRVTRPAVLHLLGADDAAVLSGTPRRTALRP